jgi:hypothetical protein
MSLCRLATARWGVVVWFILSGVATDAAAQDRLAAAKSLSCTFTAIATGTWTNGEAEARVGASMLTVRFVDIDADAAAAVIDAGLPITEVEAVGEYGPSHLITRFTGDYLHFIQMFTAGALFTTTVINRETRDGKLMAVHTRHEYTDVSQPGVTLRPEQYYGECEVGE